MALKKTLTVRGVIAPLALVLAVTIDDAVILFDVFLQMIVSQTREVAVDTADHETICKKQLLNLWSWNTRQ